MDLPVPLCTASVLATPHLSHTEGLFFASTSSLPFSLPSPLARHFVECKLPSFSRPKVSAAMASATFEDAVAILREKLKVASEERDKLRVSHIHAMSFLPPPLFSPHHLLRALRNETWCP